MKPIKPIRTDSDYEAALVEVAALMESDPPPASQDADRLDILATLVEAYESRHHPIAPPDPVDAIGFAMEQFDISRADLEAALGSKSRVSEILNRKRRLTMSMAWELHRRFGIPAESLIRPYDPVG